jgi:hypothetical protein
MGAAESAPRAEADRLAEMPPHRTPPQDRPRLAAHDPAAHDDASWAAHDGTPESTVLCDCGARFRSHTATRHAPAGPYTATRRPCPQCGGAAPVRAAVPPEP